MSNEPTITVADLCDAIGRKNIARAVPVSVSAVSNAVKDNCFPSRWYLVVKGLAEDNELPCPDSLFAFSPPAPADQKGAA